MWQTLVSERQVNRLIGRLEDTVIDRIADDWRAAAADLGRHLFASVGPLPQRTTLALAARGILSRTPFETLPWNGQPLGSQVPIVRTESMGRRTPRSQHGTDACVVGVNADGLVHATEEAGQVARQLGAEPVAAADKDLRARLLNARWVHLAMHGVLRDNIYESYFDLGRGGRFTAWQLFRDAPNAELITLSACDTAAEVQPVDPESTALGGIWNLGAFAFSGGATYVLASAWTADDRITVELMDKLYAGIVEGADVPRALQRAKLSLIMAHKTLHPYYYANFALAARSVGALALPNQE